MIFPKSLVASGTKSSLSYQFFIYMTPSLSGLVVYYLNDHLQLGSIGFLAKPYSMSSGDLLHTSSSA